jgi:hypothetical protein
MMGGMADEPEDRPARILDMTEVRLDRLADFTHPRLAKVREDLEALVADRQVVAGFGSAL